MATNNNDSHPAGIMATRTMRDTLLHTEIIMLKEDHSAKMGTIVHRTKRTTTEITRMLPHLRKVAENVVRG